MPKKRTKELDNARMLLTSATREREYVHRMKMIVSWSLVSQNDHSYKKRGVFFAKDAPPSKSHESSLPTWPFFTYPSLRLASLLDEHHASVRFYWKH